MDNHSKDRNADLLKIRKVDNVYIIRSNAVYFQKIHPDPVPAELFSFSQLFLHFLPLFLLPLGFLIDCKGLVIFQQVFFNFYVYLWKYDVDIYAVRFEQLFHEASLTRKEQHFSSRTRLTFSTLSCVFFFLNSNIF